MADMTVGNYLIASHPITYVRLVSKTSPNLTLSLFG